MSDTDQNPNPELDQEQAAVSKPGAEESGLVWVEATDRCFNGPSVGAHCVREAGERFQVPAESLTRDEDGEIEGPFLLVDGPESEDVSPEENMGDLQSQMNALMEQMEQLNERATTAEARADQAEKSAAEAAEREQAAAEAAELEKAAAAQQSGAQGTNSPKRRGRPPANPSASKPGD
ncbi:MAG: hypothetical protein AAF529_20205 [Pseudomonadota bacterium]